MVILLLRLLVRTVLRITGYAVQYKESYFSWLLPGPVFWVQSTKSHIKVLLKTKIRHNSETTGASQCLVLFFDSHGFFGKIRDTIFNTKSPSATVNISACQGKRVFTLLLSRSISGPVSGKSFSSAPRSCC